MRICVTGHQRLADPSVWEWVETAVALELDRIPPPLMAITSLAIGADQMLARLTLQFRELLNGAEVDILRVPGSDEDAFLAAGQRVVDLADKMIAISYALYRSVPTIHVNPVQRTVTELKSCESNERISTAKNER